MPVAVTMAMLLLHLACLILIDISIPVRIHPFEHCFSMARMFILADSAIIVGIRHGHSTSALTILLIALLFAVPILLVAIWVLVVIMRLGHHVTFIQGLRS